MMSSRFLPVSFLTAVLFLSSCGGNEEKAKSEKMSSDSATAAPVTTPPVAASTIVTTPQAMMVVKHKVGNFAKWKASYDAHDSMRVVGGMHNYVVARGVYDSNTVLVIVKTDDMAKAKSFAKDPKLKEAMQKGGVTGPPSFSFVTMVFQDTVAVNSTMRSLTTFMVKDWDAWQKAFPDGEQERIDNGLTVRALGHDADNNNKVVLVTAIIDSAKAAVYWKSDMLKKRRAASGVIGEPDRFIYKIVQKY